MRQANRILRGIVASIGCMAVAPVVVAEDKPPAPVVATPAAAAPGAAPLFTGFKSLGDAALASSRGGTDVFNEMKLRGTVTDNQASNLSTGNNTISDGAFSSATGFPMVVQNSGNNVLIQNATIINVQVK